MTQTSTTRVNCLGGPAAPLAQMSSVATRRFLAVSFP